MGNVLVMDTISLLTMGSFRFSISSCVLVKVKVKSLSRVRLFATAWTVAYQVPLSMGFSRQEYWSGVSCRPHN